MDYQYSGTTLSNGDDEIQLLDAAETVIDTVVYGSSLVFDGSSTTLDPNAFSATSNDDPANWCAGSTLQPGGDRGTPGAANDSCRSTTVEPPTPTPTPSPTPTPTPTPSPTPTPAPSLVTVVAPGTVFVAEFMANPAAVSDTVGEWFEVFNSSASVAVDINGWTIRDLGSNRHVIDNGGPLVIGPRGFLVLGRNGDPTTNGNVPVDYQYSGFTLSNGDDEIQVLDAAEAVIDTVVYDSSVIFNGSSTTLDPNAFSATSNDNLANWCAGSTLQPGGDRGTPGSANDFCG